MLRITTAVMLVAWLGAVAHADEDPNAVKARQHFDAAEKLFYDQADYGRAVEQYRQAYALKPHPNVLYNIALTYERMYKPHEARAYYERFLREAGDGEPELRQKAEARLRVLRSLPGAIVINTTPAGAAVELQGAGGKRVGTTPHTFDDAPPGDYHIHVALADHVPVTQSAHVEPGEHITLTIPLVHQQTRLTVITKPEGGRVFIDGKEEGTTNFSRSVATGRHRVLRVEVDDFLPHVETIDLLPDKPVERRILLKRPLRSGRTELILGGMVYGSFAGVALAEAVGAGRNLPALLLSGIGGVGIGFVASWFATGEYVPVGRSSTIIGGTVWGAVAGTSIGLGVGLSSRNVWAVALLGSGLGLGSGILTARFRNVSAGDAALVNSGGLWGSLLGTLLTESIGFERDTHNRALGWLTLGGCAVGLTTGGLLARYLELSRSHVAIIDLGGLAGLALGFGVGYLLGGNDGVRVGARYGLGAMSLGLLGAAVLARYRKNRFPVSGALLMHHQGRWEVGVPHVAIATSRINQNRETRLTVSLLEGRF